MHIGDNLIVFLKNSIVKIEELQVQTALGGAELKDRFEELKKDSLSGLKTVKKNITDKNEEVFSSMKSKLEHLEVQLALAKAETTEELNKQIQALKHAFEELKLKTSHKLFKK